MKNLVLVISLIWTGLSFAQENIFSLDFEYSPNLSKLTDEVVNEKYKLSHIALIRIQYNSKSRFKPTFGLGFMNTGEMEKYNLGGQRGIESIRYIHNYNYLLIPIGVNVSLNKFYILPEIGMGYNLSKITKQKRKYTNGERECKTLDENLNSYEFTKISIPLSISIGRNFKIVNKTFFTGFKGYYGINKVVKNVPRNNHYFGIGIVLGVKL